MGTRFSIASNIVFMASVPPEIVQQLDRLIAISGGRSAGKIGSIEAIPEFVAPELESIFENSRGYGAVWDRRKCVVPGKHYVVYGTAKFGDSIIYEASTFLEPYLDLENSWFVALYEGSEIDIVRWKRVGDHFVKQELIADLYFQTDPCPFVTGQPTLEDVDCHHIPWWYAEPIAKTLGTREFNKVIKRLQLLGLGAGKIVVRYPIFNPKLRHPAGTWRYTYLHMKAKKGNGRKHYRISTFYPAVNVVFTETANHPVSQFLETWVTHVGAVSVETPPDHLHNNK